MENLKKLAKTLKWNGQIERFFDEDGEEYDSNCINQAVIDGREISILKWTTQGYQ